MANLALQKFRPGSSILPSSSFRPEPGKQAAELHIDTQKRLPTLALFPNGSPSGYRGPTGDLFLYVGPPFCPRSPFLQNTHTFVAKITISISAHPNFVHFLDLLYISEKICTFHFLSQTGIGPLHCQSYARRSNMGKCHKLVLGLKFWSVYIFKSPLAATALSPFSISYLRKRD